jgi:hypothetical protein
MHAAMQRRSIKVNEREQQMTSGSRAQRRQLQMKHLQPLQQK